MNDASVISDETGKVIAIVINSTRYSPEAIVMLQSNTINLVDHETALQLWKEAAADALQGQEEERRKRIEAEAKAEQCAARVSDAEQAIALVVEDMLKRGETAEAIGNVMRYARDYVNLRTDTAFDGLVRSIRELDDLRKAQSHGK